MKKIITFILALVTIFCSMSLFACDNGDGNGNGNKTPEEIAMQYFNEFKGATYNYGERNETTGWVVYLCVKGSPIGLSDYLTIDNEGNCTVRAYTNNIKEFTGTFKITAFKEVKEDGRGLNYYFELSENTTIFSEFRAVKYNGDNLIYVNIVD